MKPPLDRSLTLRVGLHRDKAGEPALSIGKPASNLTRLVRRKPKRKPPKPER